MKEKANTLTHPKRISPPLDPESHNPPHRLAYLDVLPIQVGLPFMVQVEVVFACGCVPFPCVAWQGRLAFLQAEFKGRYDGEKGEGGMEVRTT